MEVITIILLIGMGIVGLVLLIWTYFIAFSQGGCLSLGLTFFFPGIAQLYYFIVLWQREGFGIYQIMNIVQILLCLMLFIIVPLIVNPGQDTLGMYRQKNYKSSMNTLTNLYKTPLPSSKGPKNPRDPKTYYENALHNIYNNDFSGAISECNKAILIKSNYGEAYQLRGYAKAAQNDYKGAIQDYNKALKLKPSSYEAYKLRGSAKAELNDYKGAINDYSLSIKVKQANPSSYFLRAIAKGNLKDKKGEIQDLEKAKALYKKQPDMVQYQRVEQYLKGIKAAKK